MAKGSAIIVGVSGGIGRALAQQLGQAGDRVVHGLSRTPVAPLDGVTHGLLDLEDEAGMAAAALAEVADWLSRHGVKASSEILVRNDATTARRLLDRAAALEAGLIVSGAYGHMRLTERVLGGVTRSFLDDSPVCLLMAR